MKGKNLEELLNKKVNLFKFEIVLIKRVFIE